MSNNKRIGMFGLFLCASLFCLSLTGGAPASAADKGCPANGKGYNDYKEHDGGPSSCHWAQEGRAGMHHHWKHRLAYAFKKLNLDSAQKTAIREIRISLKKDMIRKRADIKIAYLELGEQLHKDTVDMKTVETQVKKIGDLKASMMIAGIKAREEIKSKLTPEQRKKLAALMQKSHEHHGLMHDEGQRSSDSTAPASPETK